MHVIFSVAAGWSSSYFQRWQNWHRHYRLPMQRLGLTVRTRQQAASEFDVAFAANNHLYLIECKAERRAAATGWAWRCCSLGSLADQRG